MHDTIQGRALCIFVLVCSAFGMTQFVVDEQKLLSLGIHTIDLDILNLISTPSDAWLLEKTDLNPSNEAMRLQGLKRIHPSATRGVAHIRPCLQFCESNYETAWFVNTQYAENAFLVHILAENVPGYCVSNKTCLYTVAPGVTLHVGPPRTADYDSKISPVGGYPTIELDLSATSPLWRPHTGYKGYILTDKRLSLLNAYEVDRTAKRLGRAATIGGSRTADDWFIEHLRGVSVDPRSLCTTADITAYPATCFRLHRDTSGVPISLAIDSNSGRPYSTVNVARGFAPARTFSIEWTQREFAVNQFRVTSPRANAATAGPFRVLPTYDVGVSHAQSVIIWGRRAVAANVEAVLGDFREDAGEVPPRVIFYVSPSASIVPTVGWGRAIIIFILAIAFFRRNISIGREIRFAFRQLFYLANWYTYGQRTAAHLLPPRALVYPSSAPENTAMPGALIADVVTIVSFVVACPVYFIAAAAMDFPYPTYSAFYIFLAISCTSLVFYVAAFFLVILKLHTRLRARYASPMTPMTTFMYLLRDRSILGAVKTAAHRASHPSLTNDGLIHPAPVDSDLVMPGLLVCSMRALGNTVALAGIVFLLWWDTDNLFDWGVVSVVVGLAIALYIYHVIELLAIGLADTRAWALLKPTGSRGILGLFYFLYVVAGLVLLLCTAVPQIILPYARWIAAPDLTDVVVDYITWHIIGPIATLVISLQLRAAYVDERARAIAILAQVRANPPSARIR